MKAKKANHSVAAKTETTSKRPTFALKDDGQVVLQVTSDDHISKMLGCTTADFANELAFNCFQVGGAMADSIEKGNRALGIAMEIQPRDAVEALLATQMAATHTTMMQFSMLIANAQKTQQLEFLERAINKLARTFTAQMEALRKHRNGGKQTVTVQHVNVSDGGQAIVGNVQAGG